VPSAIAVTVAPNTQVAGGPTSPVTVTVTDENSDPIYGQIVTGTVDPPARGTLSSFGPTDANGQATAAWTPGTGSGTGAITVNAGGVSSSATITVTPGPVVAVNVTAAPGVIVADGVSTSTITAQVVDPFGNGVPGQSVGFVTSLGTIAPPSATADSNGVATATLTSAAVIMAATVQATSNGVTGTTVVQFGPPTGQFSGVFTATPAVSVTAGDPLTYTFVLTNNGPAQNNVGMIATVPEGVQVVAVSGGVYGEDVGVLRSILPTIADVRAVAWTGDLATGESHTIVVAVRVTRITGSLTADAYGVVDAVEILSTPEVTTVVVPRAQLFLPLINRST
jgi:adhesin/invasin